MTFMSEHARIKSRCSLMINLDFQQLLRVFLHDNKSLGSDDLEE